MLGGDFECNQDRLKHLIGEFGIGPFLLIGYCGRKTVEVKQAIDEYDDGLLAMLLERYYVSDGAEESDEW